MWKKICEIRFYDCFIINYIFLMRFYIRHVISQHVLAILLIFLCKNTAFFIA